MNENKYTLLNTDCLEWLKQQADKSIDLIVTDPPYGKKADKGTNGFGAAKNRKYKDNWDSVRPTQEVFDEILRVSKNAIIFGANYFSDKLPVSNCWVVWDKKGNIPFQNPFADCELIYTTFKKPIKKIVFKQQGFITDSKDKRFHPTQKPSELVQMLLEAFAKPDDVICDPFMGSGTTGIAACRLGLNFIGVEISADYCEIAKKRIEEELAVAER